MVANKFKMSSGGAAAICALMLLSACGGGGSASSPVSPSPSPTPAPTPTPTPTPAPAPAPDPTPAPPPAPDVITLAAGYTDLVAGTEIGQVVWPDGSGTGASMGGVDCITSNISHNHALVSIYRDGVRLAVPALLGLKGCTYELHTHDRTGVIHVEPNSARDMTLGQFFAVWNQPLGRTAVAGLAGPVRFFIIQNEVLTPFDGNPADIPFAVHKEIVIVTGTAPAVLPRYRWPNTL